MKYLLLVFTVFIALFASNSAQAQETKFYMKNGTVVMGDCFSINDSAFVLQNEIKHKDENDFFPKVKYDTIFVSKRDIVKLKIIDSSQSTAKVAIIYKDSVSDDYIVRGLDIDNILLFVVNDSEKDSLANEFFTETINLNDSKIEKIIVLGGSKSKNVIIGSIIGSVIGLTVSGIKVSNLDKHSIYNLFYSIALIVAGYSIGGISGGIIGACLTTGEIEIPRTPEMKYQLLDNIYYPRIIPVKRK